MDFESLVSEITEIVMSRLNGNSEEQPAGRNEACADKKIAVVLTEYRPYMESFFRRLTDIRALIFLFAPPDFPLSSLEMLRRNTKIKIESKLDPCWERNLHTFDGIVVPVFTMTLCSKLSHLIADDLSSKIVLGAIMEGKPIFTGLDEMAFLRSVSAKLPKQLLTVLGENLDAVHSMGIKECSLNKIFDEILQPSIRKSVMGNVITKEDIESALAGGAKQLEFMHGTIITPLARDYADSMNIKIMIR